MLSRSFLLLSVLFLIGCTAPIVRDTSLIDSETEKCETVSCVIKLMDTLPQGKDEDRYPWMEGSKDANLQQMEAEGKLKVDTLNPILLVPLVFGYAWMEAKPYGGMDTCDVQYLPGLNWLFLKHELSHCQGYVDSGIPIQFGEYTDEQKAIMEKENVSKWVETTYYKRLKDGS